MVTVNKAMEEFYQELHSMNMDALWRRTGTGAGRTRETVKAPYGPCRWRWSDLERLMKRAVELVTPGPDSQRRVITLHNPTLGPQGGAATHTLSWNLQCVLPGERAPSHRHTPTAIRYVVRSKGATTIVNGEPITMHPGDLILTPNWCWHGHINETNEPAMWVDGLDVPVVQMLRQGIHEDFPEDVEPPSRRRDESLATFGYGHLKPLRAGRPNPISPLWSYPWTQAEQALNELADVAVDPFDDIAMEYTNPTNGGHVLPTLACNVQMIRPGIHTRAHRHSHSVSYHVFEGEGYSVVDGVKIDWQKGDFFSLPPWAWHEHVNTSTKEEVVLFSITDSPILESMILDFEDEYTKNGGQQEIEATYEERYEAGK